MDTVRGRNRMRRAAHIRAGEQYCSRVLAARGDQRRIGPWHPVDTIDGRKP
jgi:hypothetical protein